MKLETYCKYVLNSYPEEISKEQLCKICHISKRKGLALLTNGLIPCRDMKTATHRFKIKTVDVIEYLRDREVNPEKYRITWVTSTVQDATPKLPKTSLAVLPDFYADLMKSQPSLLDVKYISEFTGYCPSAVARWCRIKVLKSFVIDKKNLIPKEWFIEFLCGPYYGKITHKSANHIFHLKTFLKCYKDYLPSMNNIE